MKRMTKLVVGIAAALSITVTAAVAAFAWNDEKKEQQAAEAMWRSSNVSSEDLQLMNNTESNTLDTVAANGTGASTGYRELEGQVKSYNGKEITIAQPFGEEETLTLANEVYIEEDGLALKEGVFVEMKVQGNVVYQIETDRNMELYGIVRDMTDKEVTVEQNGQTKSFPKAMFFRIDDEGVSNVIGLPAEIQWNADMQITQVEVDD